MKRMAFMMVLVTGLVFPPGASKAIAAESYPLVCRGGGAMTTSYTIWRGGEQAFRIRFAKARQGAGARQPAPGECAWVDRPLNNNEPAYLEFYTERGFRGIDLEMQGSNLVAKSYGHEVVRYLSQAIGKQQLFYVRAFNERGKNRLRITRTGP
ncbi:MAG: hypothetical protein DWQ09_04950 [Proteobacteria bacterium]|nr:MAG: hypothetical protein DWQ09_04950 [Pseudomonadota bacterium]QKK11308.1 MAG: hypothetical protein HND59_06610 [Pseudomonadota bacterium]